MNDSEKTIANLEIRIAEANCTIEWLLDNCVHPSAVSLGPNHTGPWEIVGVEDKGCGCCGTPIRRGEMPSAVIEALEAIGFLGSQYE